MKQKPVRRNYYSCGLRLYYLDWGGSCDPQMLFLHDLGDSSRTWDVISSSFREEYRVYSVELRGHGHSDKPSAPNYKFDDFYADIKNFASSVNLTQALVVGHGAGARLAAKLAVEKPESVSKIILYDSEQSSISDVNKWISIEEAINFLQNQRPRVDARLIDRQVRNLTSGGLDGSRAYIHDTSAYRVYMQAILWNKWLEIECPSLILRGRYSRELSHTDAVKLTEALPSSRLVELEGSGHWLHQELPDEFESVLRWFFGNLS